MKSFDGFGPALTLVVKRDDQRQRGIELRKGFAIDEMRMNGVCADVAGHAYDGLSAKRWIRRQTELNHIGRRGERFAGGGTERQQM